MCPLSSQLLNSCVPVDNPFPTPATGHSDLSESERERNTLIIKNKDKEKKELKIVAKNEKMLETTENLVYSCLDFTPRGVNGLSERTGLPARKVLELLISLELKGMVKEISKNYYIRT